MPDGSMAIYRNNSDTGGYDVTAWADLDHDTTVWEDENTFEKQTGGTAGVKLLEAGKYLVMYNDGFEISGTLDRSTIETQIARNGTAENGLYGHGYIRGADGCDECFPYSAFIIEASANDIIKPQMKQQAGTTCAPTRMADIGGFQIIKMNDSWSYSRLSAYRNLVIQGVPRTVIWYTTIEEDTADFSHSGTNITLKTTGWYLVCYNYKWTNTSSPPQIGVCGASVYNSTTANNIDQSYSSSYVKVTSGNKGAVSGICLVNTTTTNNVINLVITNLGGAGQLTGYGTYCDISIVKLPSAVNKLSIYNTSGTQSYDVSETSFNWGGEDVSEDSAFDHSTVTNTDDITIKKPGPFLFMGNFISDYSSGTDRYNTLARFRDGGTGLQYGCFGDFCRQAATVGRHGASHAVLLPWLSVNDVIDMSREDTSTSSGDTIQSVANEMGVQAIYLPSIFPMYWQNGGYFLHQGGF